LKRNAELSRRNQKRQYLVSGFVYCKRCGKRYQGGPQNKAPVYRYSARDPLVTEETCRNKAYDAAWLEEHVWAEVETMLMKPSVLLQEIERRKKSQPAVEEVEERLAAVSGRIGRIRDRETRLVTLYTYREIDDDVWKREKAKLDSEKSRLLKQRAAIERLARLAKEVHGDEALIRRFCKQAARNIKGFTFQDKMKAYPRFLQMSHV